MLVYTKKFLTDSLYIIKHNQSLLLFTFEEQKRLNFVLIVIN